MLHKRSFLEVSEIFRETNEIIFAAAEAQPGSGDGNLEDQDGKGARGAGHSPGDEEIRNRFRVCDGNWTDGTIFLEQSN